MVMMMGMGMGMGMGNGDGDGDVDGDDCVTLKKDWARRWQALRRISQRIRAVFRCPDFQEC